MKSSRLICLVLVVLTAASTAFGQIDLTKGGSGYWRLHKPSYGISSGYDYDNSVMFFTSQTLNGYVYDIEGYIHFVVNSSPGHHSGAYNSFEYFSGVFDPIQLTIQVTTDYIVNVFGNPVVKSYTYEAKINATGDHLYDGTWWGDSTGIWNAKYVQPNSNIDLTHNATGNWGIRECYSYTSGNTYNTTSLIFTSQIADHDVFDLVGYFDWIYPGGGSNREYFTGTFDPKQMKIGLQSDDWVPANNWIMVYEARVNHAGTFLTDGSWESIAGGNSFGVWKSIYDPSPWLETPYGGEVIIAESDYMITWQTEGTISNVKLEYSINNGGDWVVIEASTANTDSYEWQVPKVTSNQSLVRISDVSNPGVFDMSTTMFTIYECTLLYDLNDDCFIDLQDLALLSSEWLKGGNPYDNVPDDMVYLLGGGY